MTDTQLAWLAGILEGEGCFYLATRKNKDGTPRPLLSIKLSMTDHDVVQRAHEYIGFGSFYSKRPKTPGHKLAYVWESADALVLIPLLQALRPWMGQRRGGKIDAMLAAMDGWQRVVTRSHGRPSMYQQGCRCAPCCAANTAERRRYIAEKPERRERARQAAAAYYQAHRAELIDANRQYRARRKAQYSAPPLPPSAVDGSTAPHQ